MDVAQFWRAPHRRGHRFLVSVGTTLDGRRLSRLHTCAGHIARSRVQDLSLLLKTRCLSWWRREQARCHSKFDLLHPKRMQVLEKSQITAYDKDLHLPDNGSDVGYGDKQDYLEGELGKVCRGQHVDSSLILCCHLSFLFSMLCSSSPGNVLLSFVYILRVASGHLDFETGVWTQDPLPWNVMMFRDLDPGSFVP